MKNVERRSWLGIVVALILPTIVTWLYFDALAGAPGRLQQLAMTGGKIVQFSFPLLWLVLVLKQQLPKAQLKSNGVALGIVYGLTICLGMAAIYHWGIRPSEFLPSLQAALEEKLAGLHVNSVGKYLMLTGFYAIAHSMLEEYYWRWFVFGQLRERVSLWAAVMISSFGFMAHHVLVLAHYFGWLSWTTWLLSLAVAVGGMTWCWMYHRYQNLTAPWLSHLVVDAGIFAVGYLLVRPM